MATMAMETTTLKATSSDHPVVRRPPGRIHIHPLFYFGRFRLQGRNCKTIKSSQHELLSGVALLP